MNLEENGGSVQREEQVGSKLDLGTEGAVRK